MSIFRRREPIHQWTKEEIERQGERERAADPLGYRDMESRFNDIHYGRITCNCRAVQIPDTVAVKPLVRGGIRHHFSATRCEVV